MTSRIKQIGFTTAAGLGLFVGAAGISSAATGSNDPAPAGVEAPGPDLEEPGDTGVNCENGIDTATGAECDGGPAAAEADEANEAPDSEDDAAPTATGAASGIVAPQAVQQVSDPSSDPAPAASVESDAATEIEGAGETEGVDDEADDGVDHQFEGEEIGENGNGIPDADDLSGAEDDD